MPSAKVTCGRVFINGSAVLMARIADQLSVDIVQADIATITYTISRSAACVLTDITGHTDVSLTVADVIFDTLQTDAGWSADDTGYNFKHIVDVATSPAFATCGMYQIEYKLTPNDGQVIIVRYEVSAA